MRLHCLLLNCFLLGLVAGRARFDSNSPPNTLPRLIEQYNSEPDARSFATHRYDISLIEEHDTRVTRLTRRWDKGPNHYNHVIPAGESGWAKDGQGRVIIYYGDIFLAEHMKHLADHLVKCSTQNEGFLTLSDDVAGNRRRAMRGKRVTQSIPRRVRDEKIPARFDSQEVGQPCITTDNVLRSESNGPAPRGTPRGTPWAGIQRGPNGAWAYGYSKNEDFLGIRLSKET